MSLKFMVLSDLHFEHHADNGRSFLDELPSSDNCDVLILAGDISPAEVGLCDSLSSFATKYKKVLFVAGNHEYYGSSKEKVSSVLKSVEHEHSNFKWLDNDIFEHNGYRFLGTTMWFKDSYGARSYKTHWSDFKRIQNFGHWVFKENEKATSFLNREVDSRSIVITHYLPSFMSVHPKYAGLASNVYFVNDVEHLIKSKQPKLWIHGHSHTSCDYHIGPTRVLSNPHGYPGLDLNGQMKLDCFEV